MGITEAQQRRLQEARTEPDLQKRMVRMTVFICENCNDEVKQNVCDVMEAQINQWLESN